ncbi:hypothetical protein RB595_007625 [Gaeumannomyces hyphopodioides]
MRSSARMHAPQQSKPRTERDENLLHKYGKLPSKGSLLQHQLERRKYFDSGDFALSKTKTPSDTGTIATGSEHPTRETVAHPSSPVPSSSNVSDNASEQRRGEKQAGELRSASGLHEIVVPQTSNLQGKAEDAEQGKSV